MEPLLAFLVCFYQKKTTFAYSYILCMAFNTKRDRNHLARVKHNTLFLLWQ